MTITVKKKVTLKDHVIEEQQEKELSWLNSLRHLLPPIEDEHENTIWSKLSPPACKLYLLIWGLELANWKPPCHIPDKGVSYYGIMLYASMKSKVIEAAIAELMDKDLIQQHNLFSNERSFSIIHHLPLPEETEDGV